MIKNTDPQEFKDFTSEYTEEYKEANYKTLVRDFAILENKKLTRKVKVALIFSHGTAMVPFFTLNQYIGMTDERISNSVGERNEVLQNLLDDYINTPLKETSSNASKAYNNLTRDRKQFVVETNKFLYFYQQLAIEELIKYEKYLLEELGKVVPEKQGESEYPTNMFTSYKGYEIWQTLFDDLDIKESDLTSIRFMFEIMKKDNFIHDTFKLVDLYDWLNKEYKYVVGKLKYTDPNWQSNKARMTAYNAVKENINQS